MKAKKQRKRINWKETLMGVVFLLAATTSILAVLLICAPLAARIAAKVGKRELSAVSCLASAAVWLLCLLVLGLFTALTFLPRCPHCGSLIPRMQLNGVRVRPNRCPRCGAILTDDNLKP